MTPSRSFALLAYLMLVVVACAPARGLPAPASASADGASVATAMLAEPTPTATSATRVRTSTVEPPDQPGSVRALACSIPHEWLLRTWRGWRADRGAELQILPKEYDFVGSGLPHVGPWDYANDVPLFWYGPGHVPARGSVDRPVTVAGIAPTQAELLRFDGFHAPDGIPMGEAVRPGQRPPRLIVTVVWDAGGRDVLDTWPEAWPYLRSLIPKGTWYERASVGSSPTSTAQIHATIGTGAFPDDHGLIGHRLRISGRVTTPWEQGPRWLVAPTLADVYDRAMGNAPLVGELATVSIHLGLIGHGSMWGGGDRDIATTREVAQSDTLGEETFNWNLSPLLSRYFRFPAYVNDVTGFDRDVRAVDAADGRLDGRWRSNDISDLLQGFDTPARIPYQTRVLEEMIRREGFGDDAVPDLLFVNYKEIDVISHIWSMNSLEMRDAVIAQDAALRQLVTFLNRQVGRGQWAMVVTADHGSMVSPEVSGGFQISPTAVAAEIDAAFDHDGDSEHVVQLIQPTQIFIDTAELRQNGSSLDQVAEWVMGLTKGEVAPAGTAVAAAEAEDRVFQAAFPSGIMPRLPCLPEARP